MTFRMSDINSNNKTTMKIGKSVREALKQVARKRQTYSDLVEERILCNAADCNAAGINKIEVPAGKFGDVTLFVCDKCVNKFL